MRALLQRIWPHKNDYRKPEVVDWTLDAEQLFERIKNAIVEKHGHVYLCVDNLLPPALYNACVAYWPRDEQFEQRAHSRTRITLEWLDQAPLDEDDRAFWYRFGHEVINKKVKPALIAAFMPYMRRKFDFLSEAEAAALQKHVNFIDNDNEGLNLDKNFGIGPHVDQNYVFISSLFYMPPDESQIDLGTMLFAPRDPSTRTLNTTFLEESAVRRIHQFPFTPNTLASFLQTPVSFHGLTGKTSERPRRSYQFNIIIDPVTVARAYDDRSNTAPAYRG